MFYIALRKGDITKHIDFEIMLATFSKYVHAELVVSLNNTTRSCGAWDGESPCFQARDPSTWMQYQDYIYFEIPFVDTAAFLKAWHFLKVLLQSGLEYTTGWFCMVPQVIVDHYVSDIDVDTHPVTWKRVFCSQILLLFLKKCVKEQLLAPHFDDIMHIHSLHCSPGALYNLCEAHGLQKRKFIHSTDFTSM